MTSIEAAKPDSTSILLEILHELRRQHAQEDDLWEVQQIADYMKLKRQSVHNKVLKEPGFPTGVILPTGGRRWLAKEIKAWVVRRR